ncbi:restriction endonuclease subunit S [Cohnella sp.]|uniref:restriction endonuclease subunit S n=1 Tax=Cohnella sp. TaxID=1883426 RepID=UPI003704A9A3
MSENKENVPKVRFPGFTDDWVERKFDSMFDRIPNNTLSRADLNYDDGQIRNVHYGDILIKYGAVTDCGKDVIPFVTGAEVSKYQGQLLQNGDVLLADAAEDETVGKVTEITGITDIPVVSGLHTIACRPMIKMQPRYLGYCMNSPSYHQQLLPLMQGIKVLSISWANLAKTNICYPTSTQEQSQIGKIFANFDNLITLHQRKLNNMKKLKAGLLQKMFPKDGEDFPEVRFPGFTNAWEQRELGEISDFITKGATPTTYGFNWEEDGIPFFRNDSLKDNRFVFGEYSYISEEASATLIRSEIRCNDILIAITGDIGKVGIVPKSIKKANINQHMAKVRILEDAYPYFVYQYLSIDEIQKKFQKIKTGLSMPQLSLEQIRNTIVNLPSREEQKKIGEFFSNLDNLITLHQRKLEHVQELKKALLQQMFV